MKTPICGIAVVAMLVVAAPSFAGPNTGQPSHAQRLMQLAENRQQIERPYALTGQQERAMHWHFRVADVGAQRTHFTYVRCPARHDMDR